MSKNPLKLIVIAFFISSNCFAQNKAFDINENLGRGINMGSMFEAPNETIWENPYSSEYFPIISQLGFTHVRIPIRWETDERSSSIPPYEIYSSFFTRIKQVVDEALENGLYVIINMHHHNELIESPDEQKDRFLAQWQQIGTYFKDYSDSLLFEILNEPNGNLDANKWNILFKEALVEIRTENPERIVLIGTADWGGIEGLEDLQLPTDSNIILTVHYYDPYEFTHQGADWIEGANQWLGTEWKDTDVEREKIQNDFKAIVDFSQNHLIPVHLGEFGSYHTGSLESREKWTTFIARYAEELGFSWAYWEFSAGFGIYNPKIKTFYSFLVDALLNNTMPEPTIYNRNEVYNFSFDANMDGWVVSNFEEASSTLINTNNELELTIENSGTEEWHIQVLKYGLQLYPDKFYRVSFKAKSEGLLGIDTYIGKASSPWQAYSNYNGFHLSGSMEEYAYYFTMDTTDLNSRMVFDLGTSINPVYLDDIRIEELSLPTSVPLSEKNNIQFYPNPVTDNLYLTQAFPDLYIEIYSLEGKKLFGKSMGNKTSLNLNSLTTGIYLAKVIQQDSFYTFKFCKK